MVSNTSSEQDDFLANLRADYEQTNEQIRMLTDIRFRLLTLIPTGTIVAVSVLGATVSMQTALVVGILGFVIIFALAMYDQRNSQIYDACLNRAAQLEDQLRIPNGGLYKNRPKHRVKLLGILVWHDRALAYIYGTTLGGWFYLITYSLLDLLLGQVNIVFYLVSLLISVLIACAFIWHFHQIEASRTEQRKLTVYGNIKKSDESKDHYTGTVKVSLENSGKHAFKYNVSEFKLCDKDGRKYKFDGTFDVEGGDASTNERHSQKDSRRKGKLKPYGKRIGTLIAYQLPNECEPEALIYTPRPRFLNVQQIKHFKKIIILIRHGAHDLEPLNQEGKDAVSRLKDRLARLDLAPDIYLTSPIKHAQETAEILSDKGPDIIHPMDVLKPDGDPIKFQTIIDEAEKKGIKLSKKATIAIVGHQPKLNHILKSLTSEHVTPWIDRAEAVRVEAGSLSAFLDGKGMICSQMSEDNGSDRPGPESGR